MLDDVIGVVGASGYVGSRLVRLAVEQGREIVAISRRGLGCQDPLVRDIRADLIATQPLELKRDLAPCRVIYYLVDSLGMRNCAQRDLELASRFADGIEGLDARVVYVGSLGPEDGPRHIRSRQEVGTLLRQRCDTSELRASTVIGPGSLGHRIISTVVEEFGIASKSMTRSLCQPIAADDVIRWLELAPRLPAGVYEIGGRDVLTYLQIMEIYASELNRKLRVLPLPSLMLPYHARLLGRRLQVSNLMLRDLFESMSVDMVVRTTTEVPFALNDVRTAVRESLRAAPPGAAGFG